MSRHCRMFMRFVWAQRRCDLDYQVEVSLFEQINTFWSQVQSFVVGKPLLFVLSTGLAIAFWSVIGEVVTYWVARLGGPKLAERFARLFRIDTRHMGRTESWFQKWGVKLVLFGRIFPGVRTLVSIPAGITRMNFGVFLGASAAGAYLWNTLLVGLGYYLGFNITIFGVSIM